MMLPPYLLFAHLSLPRRCEKVALAQLRARAVLLYLCHEVRLLGILDVFADGAHVHALADPAQATLLHHAVNGSGHHVENLPRHLLGAHLAVALDHVIHSALIRLHVHASSV